MYALLIVTVTLSISTALMLLRLRLVLTALRVNYAEQRSTIERDELILELTTGQRHVFWGGIWRPMVQADRKKHINQFFGNYGLVLVGILPLVVSGLAAVGDAPWIVSVDVILNLCVSATALIMGKFSFAKYAEQHDRTSYMLRGAINQYLSLSGIYEGLEKPLRFAVLHARATNVLDSNTTSIVAHDVPQTNADAMALARFPEVFPQTIDPPKPEIILGQADIHSPVTDFAAWQRKSLANTPDDHDPITQVPS
jgi:hypothetical protein